MAVLPGWHDNGRLPRRPTEVRKGHGFSEQVDPAALPENVTDLAVLYRMPAGGMAIHHTMIPHSSKPNRSRRWRRVLVLR